MDRCPGLDPRLISPELCLVDPELASAARRLLLGPPIPEPEPELALRATGTGRRRPAAAPPPVEERPRRRPPVIPRLVAVGAVLVALVPPASVLGAISARSERGRQELQSRGRPDADVLMVPSVCRSAYVFAKGILEDSGFAWKIAGDVEGYAANRVVAQDPAPGVLVKDTGAPTVTLTLQRDPRNAERGTPDNSAPYRGTALRVWKGDDGPPSAPDSC